MSDAITIHKGGEAPHAARRGAAPAGGGGQVDVMQLSGGPATDSLAGEQQETPDDAQLQASGSNRNRPDHAIGKPKRLTHRLGTGCKADG